MTNGRSGAGRTRPIVWSSRRPPDTETFARRRVDLPAGCRAAAEPAICLCGGPSTIPWMIPNRSPPGRVAALVAQEPFDVRDQVVAGRQTLLVVHRLQSLDIAAGRLVQAGRGVEPRPQFAGLLARAHVPGCSRRGDSRALGAAPGPRSRTAPRRNGGPARSSRGPGSRPRRPRSRAPTRAPTARAACRPGRPRPRRAAARAMPRCPMIGTWRVCGTAAGIAPRLIHCTTPSRPASSITSAVNFCQR